MIRLVALLTMLILQALVQPGMAQEVQTIVIPAAGNGPITGYLMRPPGMSPRPAVIALHGCGGPLVRNGQRLSSRHLAWGRILTAAGYVVVFPDSFGSRGFGALCTVRSRPVKHADRLSDIEATRRWLAAQPFVDGAKLHVLGWSNGASTALRLARSNNADRFRRIIAFYPGCRALLGKRRNGHAPLKIIMGAADDWTPPGPCRDLAAQWKADLVLYEGAYHGFDAPASKIRIRKGLAYTANGNGLAHVGTHPEARTKAIAEVLAALKE